MWPGVLWPQIANLGLQWMVQTEPWPANKLGPLVCGPADMPAVRNEYKTLHYGSLHRPWGLYYNAAGRVGRGGIHLWVCTKVQGLWHNMNYNGGVVLQGAWRHRAAAQIRWLRPDEKCTSIWAWSSPYRDITVSPLPFPVSLIVRSGRVAQTPFSRAWLKRLSSPPHRFDLLRLSVGIGLEASLLRGDCLKGSTDWLGNWKQGTWAEIQLLPSQTTHTQTHTTCIQTLQWFMYEVYQAHVCHNSW